MRQGIWLTVHDAYQYLAVRDMFTCEVLSFRTPLLLWTCAWGRRTRHSECCVRQSLTLNHASQCQYRIHFLCFYNIVNVSSRRASVALSSPTPERELFGLPFVHVFSLCAPPPNRIEGVRWGKWRQTLLLLLVVVFNAVTIRHLGGSSCCLWLTT